MSPDNLYAPPKTEVADATSTELAPSLWNPNAAANWSLLMTPLFGAVLHMKNWEAMGVPDKAAASKHWAIANVVFLLAIVIVSISMPESKAMDSITRWGGLGVLIGWYFSLGKQQAEMVRDLYGKNYPRKGWTKPLLAAIGLYIVFFVAVGVLAFLYTLLTG